jgi:hypothetical protein
MSRTHIEIYLIRSIPPPTQNDPPAGQHDTFVSPVILTVRQVNFLLEMLHQRYTLPARNAILVRKRIQPAGHVKKVFAVLAPTGDVDILGRLAIGIHLAPLAVLCTGLVEEGLAQGVEALLGVCGPVGFT